MPSVGSYIWVATEFLSEMRFPVGLPIPAETITRRRRHVSGNTDKRTCFHLVWKLCLCTKIFFNQFFLDFARERREPPTAMPSISALRTTMPSNVTFYLLGPEPARWRCAAGLENASLLRGVFLSPGKSSIKSSNHQRKRGRSGSLPIPWIKIALSITWR